LGFRGRSDEEGNRIPQARSVRGGRLSLRGITLKIESASAQLAPSISGERVRETLREPPATDELRAILDGLPVGVFVATADGCPYLANSTAMRLLCGKEPVGKGPIEAFLSPFEFRRRSTGEKLRWADLPLVRA